MYIARGARSQLPGYVSPSGQTFSYYYSGVDPNYGEDYQILTCKIPFTYSWLPFILNSEYNLDHKEVFVDDANRFFIAQFHGPVDSINTKEIQKVANFEYPVLGFLEYKRNSISPLLNKVVAFYMGDSYEINYLAACNMFIAEKVSYLSTCIVTQPNYFFYLSRNRVGPCTYFNAKLS